MNTYRITGRAGATRWMSAELAMDARDTLTQRYNNLAKRRGLPSIIHGPGAVNGDAHDRNGSIHGARWGHGIVTLEKR